MNNTYNNLIKTGLTPEQANCLIDSTKNYHTYFAKECIGDTDPEFRDYLENYYKLVINTWPTNAYEFRIHRNDYEKYELHKCDSIVSFEINNNNSIIDCDILPANLRMFCIISEIKFTIKNLHKLEKLKVFKIEDCDMDTYSSFITTIDCEELPTLLRNVHFTKCKIINPHRFAINIESLKLEKCYICNETLVLPQICTSLNLYSTNICFDKIVFNTALQEIKIIDQFICNLSNMNLPASLTNVTFSDCVIDELPYSLIFHGFERFIIKCSGTAIIDIDGLFSAHEAVVTWYNNLNRHENLNTIYTDAQNVHNSTIQKCVLQSISNLMKLPKTVISTTRDVSHEKHGTYKLSEFDVLLLVENAIARHPKDIQDEIYKILDQTIATNNVCLTGRISKIVNVLSGFDDNVVIEISPSDQLGGLMAMHRRNNTPIDQIIADLKERGFDEADITKWTEHL
jgi:hypothetical protein